MKKQRNPTSSKQRKNRTPTLGYSLGFQNIEGTKTPNVIHHTRRESYTGLNHTIKPCIGCSREWRNKEIQLALNGEKIALRHWQKIEVTKTPNVIHHTRRESYTGLNHTIKPCIGCSREWRNKEIQLALNGEKIALRHWVIALDSKKLKVPRHQMLYTTHVEKVILV